MNIKPIGRVRRLSDDASVLEIRTEYVSGLDGVEPGASLQVLYWMHELDPGQRHVLKAHPRGDRRRAVRGVFVLRSPMRPNPIGVSTVSVTRIEGGRVFVTGLDALDGSPVIDIKAG